MFTLLLTQLALQTAGAFCGTYVGGVGAEFYNNYSQLAVVRDNNQTTLTLVNDVEGSFDSFALVIPVPEVIPEDKVNVLEPDIFDRLDAYSQPRLVTYTCEDFEEIMDTGLDFDSSLPRRRSENGDVNVEALYIVGEFEIVILSATQSGSLFTWLNDNGYQVPGQSQDLLQQYIDGGSYFLAAKVAADAGVESGTNSLCSLRTPLMPFKSRFALDLSMTKKHKSWWSMLCRTIKMAALEYPILSTVNSASKMNACGILSTIKVSETTMLNSLPRATKRLKTVRGL